MGRAVLAVLLAAVCVGGCVTAPPSPGKVRALAAVGDAKALRLAVEDGASVNATDSHGYTALAIAAFNGHTEAVDTLLDLGAELEQGPGSLRPLSLAASQGDAAMVRHLIERGAKTQYEKADDQPLALATEPEVIVLLVQAGVDSNARSDTTRETSLHRSAKAGRSKSVETLLEFGADPKLKDINDMTPLHLLCRIRNADLLPEGLEGVRRTLELLLRSKADPNAKDRMGGTPLHYAARSSVFGPEELGLLIRAGARTDVVNVNGRTPRDVAVLNGLDKDARRMRLLSHGPIAPSPPRAAQSSGAIQSK